MEQKQVESYIVNWIRRHLEQDDKFEVDITESFIENNYMDSLAFIGLMGDLESSFSIELDLTEYNPEEFTTVVGLGKIVAASR